MRGPAAVGGEGGGMEGGLPAAGTQGLMPLTCFAPGVKSKSQQSCTRVLVSYIEKPSWCLVVKLVQPTPVLNSVKQRWVCVCVWAG